MKNENNCNNNEDNSNRPCLRITAIFPKSSGDKFPPRDLVMLAANTFAEVISKLGFTMGNIQIGMLKDVCEGTAAADKELIEGLAKKELEAINEKKLAEIKNSKISVDDVLKGIKLS